ncbi:hypothetical protein [Luteitalea sp.]|nr:hypothetical protein [Luteitalea sp.]
MPTLMPPCNTRLSRRADLDDVVTEAEGAAIQQVIDRSGVAAGGSRS